MTTSDFAFIDAYGHDATDDAATAQSLAEELALANRQAAQTRFWRYDGAHDTPPPAMLSQPRSPRQASLAQRPAHGPATRMARMERSELPGPKTVISEPAGWPDAILVASGIPIDVADRSESLSEKRPDELEAAGKWQTPLRTGSMATSHAPRPEPSVAVTITPADSSPTGESAVADTSLVQTEPPAAAVSETNSGDVPASASVATASNAPVPTEPPIPFSAVWEVDHFAWPRHASLLYDREQEYFQFAGERLADASRQGLKTLAVTSLRPREGVTTVAICLARAAAAYGIRVALIDANFAQPRLGVELGLDFSQGWHKALTAPAALHEAAVRSIDDRLVLFPLAGDADLSGLSLAAGGIADVIETLRQGFDLVVIDGGTMAASGTGSGLFDAAIVVRDGRRTRDVECLAAAEKLARLGISAVGIAENFTHPHAEQHAA